MPMIKIPESVATTPAGGPLFFDTDEEFRGFYDEESIHVSSLALAQVGALTDATRYVRSNWPVTAARRQKETK